MYTIRQAEEADRTELGSLIAINFDDDFIKASENVALAGEVVAKALPIERVYVATKDNGEVVGYLCWSVGMTDDKNNRFLTIDESIACDILGESTGEAFKKLCKIELESPLKFGENVGYIELVGVKKSARGSGLAKKLIQYFIDNSDFPRFVLEVRDDKTVAHNIYSNFGFREIKKVPIDHLPPATCRIYMEFSRD